MVDGYEDLSAFRDTARHTQFWACAVAVQGLRNVV